MSDAHVDTYTFAHARDLVMRFERVIKTVGIDIRNGSILERLCLNTIDLCEKHEHPELRPSDEIDVRPSYREMVGLFDLLVKLVSCASHSDFPQLIPHLRLLNDGNPLQSVDTSVLDQENNKLFELYIAALCLGIPVDKIALDDPHSARGDNPDVLASIGGRRWGLACKSLHSLVPKTIMGNITKAIDQIERSDADTGIPVLSVKNMIAHEHIWPVRQESALTGNPGNALIFLSFPTIDEPVRLLNEYAYRICEGLMKEFGRETLTAAFKGRKSQPACLLYLPSATSIVREGRPVPVRLNVFHLVPFTEHIDPEALTFVSSLHHRLQLSEC